MKLTNHLHQVMMRCRLHGAIPSFPHTSSWHGVWFKHRDNFTYSLPFMSVLCSITLNTQILFPSAGPVLVLTGCVSVEWEVCCYPVYLLLHLSVSLINVMKGICFLAFLRTVAVGQTALEVGFAGVLHHTGVCGCARVCAFLVLLSQAVIFFFCKYEYAYGCVSACVCIMRSNLLLEFLFLLFQFIYYFT